MRIVCIGQCAWDMTFPIHEPLTENQKYRIMEPFSCIGAPAANAAYLCALWGEETGLITRIGKDFYGQEICRILESVHVDCAHVQQDEQFTTPCSAIIANSSNGYRTIFNCPGNQRELSFTYPQTADYLLLDGHELQASLAALKRFPDAISVLDAGTCRKDTKTLGALVDHLVCSQDFAYQYTGISITLEDRTSWETTFAKLKELNQKQLVVTLGENGLLYEEKGSIHHIPAFAVHTIDSTGAGDIFHGAYTYALSKGYTLLETLQIASATSAISVQTLGGQTSIPKRENVTAFLRAHGIDMEVR